MTYGKDGKETMRARFAFGCGDSHAALAGDNEPRQAERDTLPPRCETAVSAFWCAVATNPGAWSTKKRGYDTLLGQAENATCTELRRVLDWLELAIVRADRNAAIAAVQYLALMPELILARDCDRMRNLLTDRSLALAWSVPFNPAANRVPPCAPRFGNEAGYGLIRSVPCLYEKLAMLDPWLEDAVSELAREARDYGMLLSPALLAMAAPRAAKG